jgi:hypothetical protein
MAAVALGVPWVGARTSAGVGPAGSGGHGGDVALGAEGSGGLTAALHLSEKVVTAGVHNSGVRADVLADISSRLHREHEEDWQRQRGTSFLSVSAHCLSGSERSGSTIPGQPPVVVLLPGLFAEAKALLVVLASMLPSAAPTGPIPSPSWVTPSRVRPRWAALVVDCVGCVLAHVNGGLCRTASGEPLPCGSPDDADLLNAGDAEDGVGLGHGAGAAFTRVPPGSATGTPRIGVSSGAALSPTGVGGAGGGEDNEVKAFDEGGGPRRLTSPVGENNVWCRGGWVCGWVSSVPPWWVSGPCWVIFVVW